MVALSPGQRLADPDDPGIVLAETLLQRERGPVSPEDLERISRAAAAGSSAEAGRLARAAMARAWWSLLLAGGLLLLVGFGAGWTLHRPGGWDAWAGAPVCQGDVCWVPVRVGDGHG